jgi:hypothetical protein
MTMYVIEDDNNWVLDRTYHEFTNDVDRAMLFDEPIALAKYAKNYGGHVVELVEKPERATLELTSDQEQGLAALKDEFLCEADQFARDSGISLGSNVFQLFADGYDVVRKPKRWNVKVPHTKTLIYYKIKDVDDLGAAQSDSKGEWVEFTAAEIDHHGLQDCEKEEVTDDEQ